MAMPSKGRFNYYEGLFIVAQGEGSDLQSSIDHLNGLFERAQAEVVSLQKWDERRFAYPIGAQRRGTYLLVYFGCDPVNIEKFDRDCNLSEVVVRQMITKADHMTREQMEAADRSQEAADEAALRGEGEQRPAEPAPAVAGEQD